MPLHTKKNQPLHQLICLQVTLPQEKPHQVLAAMRYVSYCRGCSTIQYSTVQYSTAQHSTAQHSTVQYSTVQYSTVQYSTVQYSTVQYSTVQCSTAQYITLQYSTVQYSTVQCSTVQYSNFSIPPFNHSYPHLFILIFTINHLIHMPNHYCYPSSSITALLSIHAIHPYIS